MLDSWDSSLYDDSHSYVWKKSSDLIDLLSPTPGERVLDLGCGTGHLTSQIAARGADVTGIDSSLSMIAQARQNFPKLRFQLADARTFRFDHCFDAVFSNAALHWVPEADQVAAAVASALKPGGRFVLEMGGRGNIARIRAAVEGVLSEAGYHPKPPWYFPSAGEYASVLERHGFEVELAQTFPRWNKLEHPERGLREWMEMFAGSYFEQIPDADKPALISRIEEKLRPELRCDGYWYADYRRLRVMAVAAFNPLRTQSGMPIP